MKNRESDGVSWDTLTMFMCEVTHSLLIGEREHFSYVPHDYLKKEWEVIGKIIVYNIKKTGHFYVLFCKDYLMHCLDLPVGKLITTDSFMGYLSYQEKKTYWKYAKRWCYQWIFVVTKFYEIFKSLNTHHKSECFRYSVWDSSAGACSETTCDGKFIEKTFHSSKFPSLLQICGNLSCFLWNVGGHT